MGEKHETNAPLYSMKITIAGIDYVITGSSEEQLQAAAEQADRVIKDTMQRCPGLPQHSQLILAVLNLAEDYCVLKEQYIDLKNKVIKSRQQQQQQIS